MKVSVSLPPDDIEFLDTYAHSKGFGSRSAVVQKAVGLLRTGELTDAYEDAWQSWASSDEEAAWNGTTADGLEA